MATYNIDVLLKKFGEEEDGNEVVGKLFNRDITLKESREHPEILHMPEFLSIHRIEKGDWECEYCGGLRPKIEYKCGYCGALRKIKNSEGKKVDAEIHKEFLRGFFKKWSESINHQLGVDS